MPMESESMIPLREDALSLDERVPAEAHANGNESRANGTGDSAVHVDEDQSSGRKIKKKKKKNKSKGSSAKPLPTQKLVEQFFPWTAVCKPAVGRCAVASRDIKAGEVVVAEHCVVFIPRSQDRTVVCHFCCCDISPPAQSFECPGCRYAIYCKACKKGAMEEHKHFCQVSNPISGIAKIADCDEDLLRLVFVLVLKGLAHKNVSKEASNGGIVSEVSKVGTVHDGIIYPSYEDAISLKTHSDKATPAWKDSVRKGCVLLYEEAVKAQSVDNLDVTVGDFITVAGLVNTNSHGMGAHGAGFHNADVAVGIFPFVSMLNHSCRLSAYNKPDEGRYTEVLVELLASVYRGRQSPAATPRPNCCFSSEGRFMYVRATQDIPKGEEGCMCTTRGCGGVVIKTSSFYEQDPTAAPGDFVVQHNSSWKCDQCSRVLDPKMASYPTSEPTSLGDYPWQLVATAEERLAAAMDVYRERRFKDARVLLEHYISQFTGKLHPLNVLLFDALTPLMNCCRATGDAAEGSRICRSILNDLEKVLQGVSLEQANFYFCLGEMYSQRSESAGTSVMAKHYKKLAQEAFQQVRKIREICLGRPSLPS